MRPAVRLAALMRLPVAYVWTHDSIGLGEDGPTHQPIEHLAALRAIPGLNVIRPGDPNETVHAWRAVLEIESGEHHSAFHVSDTPHIDGPSALALTRQDVPVLVGTSYEGVRRGGYVLAESSTPTPQVILIGTGSELQLAVAARIILEEQGIGARVVSMPCVEWFDAQEPAYREQVLPAAVRARVTVEAGIAMPWYRFAGDAGEIVSIEHFGASADYKTLFREFGITTEHVVEAARRSLDKVKG